MHARRVAQRHARLIRWTAVLAGAAVASCALLASGATASTSDTLVLSPATAPIAQLQQFSVWGFAPDATGEFVDVVLNGTIIGQASTGDGDYRGTVTAPAAGQPGAVACGANAVSVENPPIEGPGTALASATLTAQCTTAPAPAPAITPQPTTIAQASEPAPVVVNGVNFTPGNDAGPAPPVAVSVDGHPAGSATTDFDGAFSLTIRAVGLACGVHQLTASQSVPGVPALTASSMLTVTGCRQTPKLTLALDPAVLEPGEVTHVTGTGFTPAQPVTLTWRTHGGGAPVGGPLSVIADSHGHIGAFDLVMPGAQLGACQLVATQAGTTVVADAVIDAGPMQPSSGDRLIYRGS